MKNIPVMTVETEKSAVSALLWRCRDRGISGVDTGAVEIKVNDDGFYSLMIGATDMGTGCDTILTQMVAECLECEMEDIVVHGVDTDNSPYDCGSYASSTTYVTGMAVVKTCETLREKICERGAEYLGCSPDDVEFDGEKVVNLKTKRRDNEKRNRKQSNVQQQPPLSATEAFSSPVSRRRSWSVLQKWRSIKRRELLNQSIMPLL